MAQSEQRQLRIAVNKIPEKRMKLTRYHNHQHEVCSQQDPRPVHETHKMSEPSEVLVTYAVMVTMPELTLYTTSVRATPEMLYNSRGFS